MPDSLPVRTVVFDLDDTLHPEADYVRSGFRAVDAWLRGQGLAHGFLERAERHFSTGVRGRIFDFALADLGIPATPDLISRLVTVYREHQPAIRLDVETATLLESLHGNHDLALITDGPSVMQRRKIEALELPRWFSCIVVTDEWGREFWKPHPAAFRRVMESLSGPYVYVGDNPVKDFIAPRQLGWRTVRLRRPGGEHAAAEATHGAEAETEIDSLHSLLSLLSPLRCPS